MAAFVLGSGMQNYVDAVKADLDPGTGISDVLIRDLIVKAVRRINLKLGSSVGYCPATSGLSPIPSETIGTFIVLQAECLLTKRIRSTAVGKGIKVRDGDSEIDTTAGFDGYRDQVEDICGELEQLINQYRAGIIGDNDIASKYGQIIWYGNSNIIADENHNGDGNFVRDESSPFEDNGGYHHPGLGRHY